MEKIQLGHHRKGKKYKYPIMWAIVDDGDFEELNKFKWSVSKGKTTFYAVTGLSRNRKRYTVRMHCLIMDTPKEMEIDHIDNNGLNNTRKNLRICTHSENMMNTKKHSNNTSGFKGVNFYKRYKKWEARIRVNGKRTRLGFFDTAEEAHNVYCKACINYHGKFAYILAVNS